MQNYYFQILSFISVLFSCVHSQTNSHPPLSFENKECLCNDSTSHENERANIPFDKTINTAKPEIFSGSSQDYHGTITQMIESLSQASFDIQKQGRALSPDELERLEKIKTIISLLKEVEKNL